jgi:protein tyrosine/serine phosphatase
MLFIDHGIFRFIYSNSHRLSDKAWRSAQPAPHQLRGYAKAGVRTIVNLRGERDCGSFWLERRACERHGLKLVNFQVRSRAAPTREELRGAQRLFEEIEYPILMHCKSGADRAGLGATLYRHFRMGEPIAQIRQLHWKYGHFQFGNTGSLNYFFGRYLADNAREPMAFVDWVQTRYDFERMTADFNQQRRSRLGTWFVDTFLRRE